MQKKSKIDYQLLVLIMALLTFGLISLYSASTVKSFEDFGNTTRYIFHQLIYGVSTGLIAMWILAKIDYHKWQKLLPVIILISLCLLALVKAPGIGFSAGGATRWIHFGSVFFQPSEIAKLAVIIYLAAWAAKKKQQTGDFVFGILPSLIITGLFASLILWQPDFGTMSIILSTAAVLLFVSGVRLKHFLMISILAIAALVLLIKFEPYRYERLVSFINPTIDRQGASYQINQALLGVGAGGSWGYGYGLSRQKYNYLPQPMNDSIFAVTAEELGFFRSTFLIILFLLFMLKGFAVAKKAQDAFGKYLAAGISVWIGLQALINICSMIGLLPLTGVPLPFFSYGSSSMLVVLAAMGILMNISKQAK